MRWGNLLFCGLEISMPHVGSVGEPVRGERRGERKGGESQGRPAPGETKGGWRFASSRRRGVLNFSLETRGE